MSTELDRARALASPLLAAAVAVPSSDLRPCSVCHSGVAQEYSRCYPCQNAQWTFGALPSVLPITLSVDRGQIHHALLHYKDDRDAGTRSAFTMQLAGLLALFRTAHAGCIGDFDVVTSVPSPTRNAPKTIVERMTGLRRQYEDLLFTDADREGTHTLAADRYDVTSPVKGQRVLLLDDTFTTGASTFSAAAALKKAGAVVDTVLVLGRHINPSWPESAALLQRIRDADIRWSEAECVRCRPSTSLF